MPFILCIVPVAPMRSDASHKSEQVSQLLFGEVAEVIETAKDFTGIKNIYDDYEGWCQSSQFTSITNEQLNIGFELLSNEWIREISVNGKPMHVPLGSCFSQFPSPKNVINNYEVAYEAENLNIEEKPCNVADIPAIANKYLNTPYLWGGRSVFGSDCSGFTQMVFKFLGIKLKRDAYQQATQGELVGFLQEARCGDLAFFDNADGKITHVGILLDAGTIIHSSGKVRVDAIDNMGIINSDSGERTHQLRIIKRVII